MSFLTSGTEPTANSRGASVNGNGPRGIRLVTLLTRSTEDVIWYTASGAEGGDGLSPMLPSHRILSICPFSHRSLAKACNRRRQPSRQKEPCCPEIWPFLAKGMERSGVDGPWTLEHIVYNHPLLVVPS